MSHINGILNIDELVHQIRLCSVTLNVHWRSRGALYRSSVEKQHSLCGFSENPSECHRFVHTLRVHHGRSSRFSDLRDIILYPCSTLVPYSAPIGGAAPLPQGFLCPLTSAPFGHDHQRRRAEQRRLAPGDPAPAPPSRRRHPAGGRPDSVDHATDR